MEMDFARVPPVPGRYPDMQGLRTVVDGVSLLGLWMIMRLGSPEGSARPALLAGLLWVLGTMWAVRSVALYYRNRLGQATREGQMREDAPESLGYAVYRLLLVSAALWLGGWFGFVLPLLTLRAAYVTWRDWPHRAHWLLLVIVGTAFSFAMLAVSHRLDLLEWQWRFIWTAAPSLVVVGLLDHRALVESMRGRAQP
jgi:hypothetical protein